VWIWQGAPFGAAWNLCEAQEKLFSQKNGLEFSFFLICIHAQRRELNSKGK
jgi:hypothetical protein